LQQISDMDTRIIKGLIALALLAWAVLEFIQGHIWTGIFIVLLAAIAVLFVFRSIRMLMAFAQLRTQKIDKAKVWLNRIKKPEYLWKSQQAYYYYLKGLTDGQTEGMAQAEKYFKKALGLGLRMNYDKAVAKLNLAMIALSKNRPREAQTLITEVKKLDNKNMLRNEIKTVNDALKRGPMVSHRKY